MRHVTSEASAGHHMTAVTIMPNAMPRWPDQITSAQITELNNSVNKR
jgi:hypothetical protein